MNKIVMGVLLCFSLAAGCTSRQEQESIEVCNQPPIMPVYEAVIPSMPEIDDIADIAPVVYKKDADFYDELIDVSTQLTQIEVIKQQSMKQRQWIKQYNHCIGLADVQTIIAQCDKLRSAYELLGSYTYAEWRMLAVLNNNEAPYCTDKHKQYVSQVCINRCSHPLFDDTIVDNLIRPGQYSPWFIEPSTADLFERRDADEWQRSLDCAQYAMMGLTDMPDNIIFQSNFSSLGTVWRTIYVDTGWYQSYTYFSY